FAASFLKSPCKDVSGSIDCDVVTGYNVVAIPNELKVEHRASTCNHQPIKREVWQRLGRDRAHVASIIPDVDPSDISGSHGNVGKRRFRVFGELILTYCKLLHHIEATGIRDFKGSGDADPVLRDVHAREPVSLLPKEY